MKRRIFSSCLMAVLVTTVALRAADTGGNFIPSGAIDVKTVVPPPPPAGSVAALADLETVLQVQAARTPADVAWAKLVEKDDAFDNASVLGPWFTKENLPLTAELLKRVTADSAVVSRSLKGLYARPRPPLTEPTVHPCVELPDSGSYPSGHSMRAFLRAAVLSEIFPDRQVDLYVRAHHVAWGRVIGGVHFPSDLIGGRLLAQAIVAELRKNPAYHAAVEKCRAEAAPFLLKKAA
jgi:acid phosphatase (class A)